MLPALIAAAAGAALIFFLLGVVEGRLVAGELMPARAERMEDSDMSLYIETLFRDASGSLLTEEEVDERAPMEPLSLEYGDWLQRNFEAISLMIPGSRYPEVELREALALAAFSLVGIGLARWSSTVDRIETLHGTRAPQSVAELVDGRPEGSSMSSSRGTASSRVWEPEGGSVATNGATGVRILRHSVVEHATGEADRTERRAAELLQHVGVPCVDEYKM